MNFDTIAAAVEATGLKLRGGLSLNPQDQLPPFPAKVRRTLCCCSGWSARAPGRPLPAVQNGDSQGMPLIPGRAGSSRLWLRDWEPYRCSRSTARPTGHSSAGRRGRTSRPLADRDSDPSRLRARHAYRAALLFAERIDIPPPGVRARPCDTCTDRPCLSACPVGAFTELAYRVDLCISHISSPAGVMCIGEGCRARDACPVGRAFRYPAEQMRFHMEAFRRAHQRPPAGDRGSE